MRKYKMCVIEITQENNDKINELSKITGLKKNIINNRIIKWYFEKNNPSDIFKIEEVK